MIAHRVPGERLANTTVGALGANIAMEANRVYKEGVVEPSQEILNSRLRRFVAVEYANESDESLAPGDKNPWLITMQALDERSEREDLDQTVIGFHGNLMTLREGRHKIGLGPLMQPKKVPSFNPDGSPMLGPDGQQIVAVPTEGTPVYDQDGNIVEPEEVESPYNDMLFTELPGAAQQAGGAGAVPPGVGGLVPQLKKSRDLEAEVHELLRQARETQVKLAEMADAAVE